MRQLQRIFRRERGVSPKKFLESQRLEEARGRLLKGDGLKVIAEELGYCDVPHLSRAFRRFYGIGPADYRRRARMSPSELPQPVSGAAVSGSVPQASPAAPALGGALPQSSPSAS
jgi:AraC-like DNA-binding protein